jgi:hypothetical protein
MSFDQQSYRSPEGDALVEWIGGVTGRDVVIDQFGRGGPRPDKPFATIKLTKATVGRHVTEFVVKEPAPVAPLPNIEEQVSTLNEVSVSMNLIKGNTVQDFSLLRSSLGASRWQDVLSRGGLGFSRLQGPRDLTAIEENDWESRQQGDWFFYAVSVFTEEQYSIESIEIRNSLRTPTSIITVNQNTGS